MARRRLLVEASAHLPDEAAAALVSQPERWHLPERTRHGGQLDLVWSEDRHYHQDGINYDPSDIW